jgi:hypothetical protein
MAKAGVVMRYSYRMEVDNGDDMRALSISEWKRGQGAGTLRDGLAHCEGKEEEGGERATNVAGQEREGQRHDPKWLFHFLFPLSIS